MSLNDWKFGLNAAQSRAANILEGPVLVIAGAGSGKTKTIEHRVMHLLQESVRPESILLLTFTRSAAKEMLHRAAARDSRAAQVDGGTFHAFAYRMIQHYASQLGLPTGFSILDEADAAVAVGRSISLTGVAQQTSLRFPDKGTLREVFSKMTNCGLTLDQALVKDYPHFRLQSLAIERVRQHYIRYKMERGLFDYDDLLAHLVILLRNEQINAELAKRFRYVMVDEFQDVNHAQAQIGLLLAQSHGNLFVVGDDAQSIYGFRGSRREYILRFPRSFPGRRVNIIKLERNYRSTQPILDVANALLTHMPRAYRKTLKAANDSTGDRPGLFRFQNPADEAEWIAEQIARARDEEISLDRQAVLYRSGYLAIHLQLELGARGIPFRVFGGMKVAEAAHVKDVTALLRLICNCRDAIAWARVLHLHDGIGPRISHRLADAAKTASDLDGAINSITIAAAGCPSKVRKSLAAIAGALHQIQPISNPTEQFALAVEYNLPLLERAYDDHPRRLDDLKALVATTGKFGSLEDLLGALCLDPVNLTIEARPGSKDDEHPLTLSTIHSAKGLEWDHVTILGVADRCLPTTRSLCDHEALDEEHRLLYVAVTRARKQLAFTMTIFLPGVGLVPLSRFLNEPDVLPLLQQSPSGLSTQLPDQGQLPTSAAPPLNREHILSSLLAVPAGNVPSANEKPVDGSPDDWDEECEEYPF